MFISQNLLSISALHQLTPHLLYPPLPQTSLWRSPCLPEALLKSFTPILSDHTLASELKSHEFKLISINSV